MPAGDRTKKENHKTIVSRSMYIELHPFYYTEVHVGKNLEEQYEEYKGTKKKY